jgi:hypothetical protein
MQTSPLQDLKELGPTALAGCTVAYLGGHEFDDVTTVAGSEIDPGGYDDAPMPCPREQ